MNATSDTNDSLRRSRMSMEEDLRQVRRDHIVSQAIELFYERGYSRATLDALAENLGVAKPFIYNHFKSKESILIEICERGVVNALLVADKAILSDGSPTERLRNMIQKFTLVVLEHQQNVTIYFREVKNLPQSDLDRIQLQRADLDRKMASLLVEGVGCGQFKVEDPQLAAIAMRGMVSWAYTWFQPVNGPSKSDISTKMAELALSMVNAVKA